MYVPRDAAAPRPAETGLSSRSRGQLLRKTEGWFGGAAPPTRDACRRDRRPTSL